ncbi:MAG TPA: T9SS type A sorting domain-containing protein [Bacteroidales bacterium]|nr:T9SS type A sorting domain-containing protein [Bacteroidales bacterium]
MKQIFTWLCCITIISVFAQTKQLGTDTIRINVTVAQAKTMVDTNGVNPDFVILDVRTPAEYCPYHIENAININYYETDFHAQIDALDHNKMYLLHCAAGSRSGPAFTYMQNAHFREVYHMYNGINEWISALNPTVSCITAAQNINKTKLYEIYPNPASDFLNINFTSETQGKLFLYDINGKAIREQVLDPGFRRMDISDIPKGMYIIKILSDKDVYTEKITIL